MVLISFISFNHMFLINSVSSLMKKSVHNELF